MKGVLCFRTRARGEIRVQWKPISPVHINLAAQRPGPTARRNASTSAGEAASFICIHFTVQYLSNWFTFACVRHSHTRHMKAERADKRKHFQFDWIHVCHFSSNIYCYCSICFSFRSVSPPPRALFLASVPAISRRPDHATHNDNVKYNKYKEL